MRNQIEQLARDRGVADIGFATGARLTGPDSVDPTYLLLGAKSIISLMMPLDGEIIRDYLSKKAQKAFEEHETEVYRKLYYTGEAICNMLQEKGYRAVTSVPNLDYRFKDGPYKKIPYVVRQKMADWLSGPSLIPGRPVQKALAWLMRNQVDKGIDWNLVPSFSCRYGAVLAGIGHLGWSGNVLHPEWGARVLYETVITDMELDSSPMLEENPCDGCRLCTKVCQSHFISIKEKERVSLGGKTFVHNKKGHHLRCLFVCAGFSGQNEDLGWSTWSPGRIRLPKSDTDLVAFWGRFVRDNIWKNNFYASVLADLVFHTKFGFIDKKKDRFASTCGNCQLICWKEREDRQKNMEILFASGEVSATTPYP